ncbi:MAG: hypothetical protein ACXACH_03425 [Candidatus Hermodarchaeia archaeon]
MIPFSEVWERITQNAKKVFYTKKGLKFTYAVQGNSLTIDRTKYPLTWKDVMSAYRHVPLEGPGELAGLVRGQSYIWAILHDNRIRKKDW